MAKRPMANVVEQSSQAKCLHDKGFGWYFLALPLKHRL